MDRLKRLVDTSQLKTTIWKKLGENPRNFSSVYNKRVDSFTLYLDCPTSRKVVHYLDEHVALLYDPENFEIIGLRFESFKRGFLPKYSALQRAWKLSDTCDVFEDFGDISIAAKEQETKVANELSKITYPIAMREGLELPVPA